MIQFVITVLAASLLVQPALSAAGDKPADSAAKPSSFVPHPHSNHHVYGAPIETPIVGRHKTANHKNALKRRSASAVKRERS
jgi:hypothetical protein